MIYDVYMHVKATLLPLLLLAAAASVQSDIQYDSARNT